ncbi:AraC family transcriptional regulator [Pseudomonas sp. NA-150]|uniref:AraC family transcriptional regulator n=1 Tax=Pseudomonas sp. NA-150 TaxID=3367525 RepID=UPI0037C595FB
MKEKHSVSSYFVNALLYRFDDPQQIARLLRASGFTVSTLEALEERVPPKLLANLWLAVIKELDDEFFGFDSHRMPIGSFALICRGLIQAPTVGKALGLSLEYFGLFLRDIRSEVQVRGKRVVVVMHSAAEDEQLRSVVTETFLILIIGLMCWLAGRRIPISRARFAHGQPAHGDEHLLWGAYVEFNAAVTEIEIDKAYMRLPVIQDRKSLYSFLRDAPQSVFIRFRNRGGFSARVHQRLKTCGYDHWPTLEQLAVEFDMTLASLRRALQREGFSFQEIKDEVRQTIAFERLRSSQLSIAEIAQEVGFREPSAFHRAFKQWTGESPGSFRLRG